MANVFSSGSDTQARGRRSRGLVAQALGPWLWIAGVCGAILVATYMMFVEPPPPRKLTIASGSQGGAYFRFAHEYARELRRHGLTVEVRETAGSVENLNLLRQEDSDVSIAIVQSGLANEEDAEHFLALGSLYREPLWIFHRGDEKLDQLSQLRGRRIGVGAAGSGTHAIAMRLLAANGVVEAGQGTPETGSPTNVTSSPTRLVVQGVAETTTALQDGRLDAACFVAAFEADYIQQLLVDERVKLLTFDQQEAYRRRFRFLSSVILPAGAVDLGRNIPNQNIALLAPTAMLTVRSDFHPALVPLLLSAATRIHGKGNELCEPGEFPSESYCDLPVSDDARRFYRSGQPFLQRLLPFWLASLVDRAKLMVIPFIMLMMPLVRAAPPLIRWRTRRKIYRWYSALREIDQEVVIGEPNSEIDRLAGRLNHIERQVAHVEIPLSYMKEFYHLRLHMMMLRQRLQEARAEASNLK